ncbi:MAG: 50S ribosomal protein L2 [Chloroflexota bacterium]
MGLKVYRPTSPARRGVIAPDFAEITKEEPEKTLVFFARRQAGRNNRGIVTCRHRGGGARRFVRIIDFKRDKIGVPGRVAAVEYDPGRSARLALIFYADGEKRYILAPDAVKVGDVIRSGEGAEIKPGNTMPMKLMPSGTMIHNIEIIKGRGGQLVRSAGTTAQLMGREGDNALIRLPSGEMRRVPGDCMATIGQLGNAEHKNIKLGKAGKKRFMGFRPTVRGGAMSPRDHPHGGGSARCPIGLPGPKTPWGKPARGVKTRRRKVSNNMIVNRRGK